MEGMEDLQRILHRIYGAKKGDLAFERIRPLVDACARTNLQRGPFFSEKDVYLITYADSLGRSGEPPLRTFRAFADAFLADIFNNVHFLPFFPYSSDDGFSVTDFSAIRPDLGTWEDVARIGKTFKLMFDFVINHFSAGSGWFAAYLANCPGFEDFAVEVHPDTDLSAVTRPRALPLLTPFTKKNGETAHVWTTFSEDQIDFNYRSLNVLEQMIKILLAYVRQGARALRLDAIAYLWKEIGTNCIHRPETHQMVKLFRKILDHVAPDVVLITETNVPHDENISYFGNGRDEAQMVYNFTLPPLLLHAFQKEDATILSRWAENLLPPSPDTTFFNFTASHDGIGVRPLEGILPQAEINLLVDNIKRAGGAVSYKQNPDGSRSPYELNITYLDAVLGDEAGMQTEKFMASQAIQYVLPGVPATYIHSLLGSRNWHAGVAQTGRARSINREKLDADKVIAELNRPEAFRSRIFRAYREMIRIRTAQPAFHPTAASEILHLHPCIFAIRRTCPAQSVLALTNISSRTISLSCLPQLSDPAMDILTGNKLQTRAVTLQPYTFAWLENLS